MRAILFTTLLLTASPALAQSVFDGTWKADLKSTTYQSPPDVFSLAGGRYSCSSCKPPMSVPADGAFHHVTGFDYFDEAAVKIIDPRTARITERKGGKTIYEETDTVSADGKLLTQSYTDTSAARAVTGISTETRIGAAPQGLHPLSGRWNPRPPSQVSDTGMVLAINVVGDVLSVSSPTGVNYTARFGGPAVLVKGDIGGTTVRAKRLGANSFQITESHGGAPTSVATMTVSGRTLSYSAYSPKYGTRTTLKAYKQ